jgi:hypothetical protein
VGGIGGGAGGGCGGIGGNGSSPAQRVSLVFKPPPNNNHATRWLIRSEAPTIITEMRILLMAAE